MCIYRTSVKHVPLQYIPEYPRTHDVVFPFCIDPSPLHVSAVVFIFVKNMVGLDNLWCDTPLVSNMQLIPLPLAAEQLK